MPDTTPITAVPFVEEMFAQLWKRRPEHPTSTELFDLPIQSAVDILRQVTGITHEDLAKRIFVTVPQLNYITLRGTPMRAEYADRLAKIAMEYGAGALHEYFVKKAAGLRRKSRKPRNYE